jgi:hypothetical protein
MNLLGILIVLAGPSLAVAWIVSEFKGGRKLRLTFGILAMISMTVVTWFSTLVINQFNYNSWYGHATKDLVDETVRGIESNRTPEILKELKQFQADYQPTYENRAKYAPLVEQTVARMKASNRP